ncbi:XPA protein C-terminus-domain-containing protein [Dipodascopsis tothii]|uniref:XPA protein C-terminus-domain-containing protein n=1 Tax=Dipodascopsis tothii TaxID=44089 RepID=UPI0034CF6E25
MSSGPASGPTAGPPAGSTPTTGAAAAPLVGATAAGQPGSIAGRSSGPSGADPRLGWEAPASTAPPAAEHASTVRDASKKRPYDSIEPARKFSNFIEYDFSKMKDSKGGFMNDEADELARQQTLAEWQQKRVGQEMPSAINPEENPKCFECDTIHIDYEFLKVFGCRVCHACKNKVPEKYSLLTKTECREDYLLTEPELRDGEAMPHLDRPNPHKTTYNNMMLYLRYQVEEFAYKKWDGEEGLDREYERRQTLKKEKKDKKFLLKLRDMRKRTRTETWNKRLAQTDHVHEWSDEVRDADRGVATRQCLDCGMQTEEIAF